MKHDLTQWIQTFLVLTPKRVKKCCETKHAYVESELKRHNYKTESTPYSLILNAVILSLSTLEALFLIRFLKKRQQC